MSVYLCKKRNICSLKLKTNFDLEKNIWRTRIRTKDPLAGRRTTQFYKSIFEIEMHVWPQDVIIISAVQLDVKQ